MSDNKKAQNEKRNKSFREKVVDQFPEDFKPDYKPKEFDALNDSGKEIIAQTGVKDIFMKMLIEESDRKGFDMFWDALVEKKAKEFEQLREGIKDDKIRRQILKKMIEESKYGKQR
tara:strand:- start:1404 stop:1751 length:348 start_codon:yes stop_codon:yes gene_type:complete